MISDLDAEFDYVILGTNFENAVLAGALSRIGKHVLLVDRNSYYGSNHATLSFTELSGIENPIKDNDFLPFPTETLLNDLNRPVMKRTLVSNEDEIEVKKEEILPEPRESDTLHLCSPSNTWKHPPILFWNEKVDAESRFELMTKSHKYNIDLISSMILSGGEVVDVLATSGVESSISVLFEDGEENHLVKMPCSRRDLFSNKNVSLNEKRLLMNFFQYIVDYSARSVTEAKEMNDVSLKQGRSLVRPQNKEVLVIDLEQYENTSFSEFLEKEFKITGVLRDMIIHSICLAGSTETLLSTNLEKPFVPLQTKEGLERVEEFITSLNIFGPTPFLYPLYGGGEILQSYCRLNNVYGGITMLQTSIHSFIGETKTNRIVGIEMQNKSMHKVIRCKNVIASDDYPLRKTYSEIECYAPCKVIHGIYIVKGNNLGTVEKEMEYDLVSETVTEEKNTRDIVVIPANKDHRAIFLIVLNSEFKTTPSNELLIQAFMEGEEVDRNKIDGLYEMMDNAVDVYLKNLNSTIPVSHMYTCHYVECSKVHDKHYANYYFWPSRIESNYLYLDHRMKRVREFFNQLCPGAEFLPSNHNHHDSEKEDFLKQEFSHFDELLEKIEKAKSTPSSFFVCC